MKISLFDRSLYYKGLMLLIRKDRAVHEEERNMMINIGKLLGFDLTFCENAINEILGNKYIIDSPPIFSTPGIALSFIKDGLRLSISDGYIHEAEIAWLESIAESNGIGDQWRGEYEKFRIECDACRECIINRLDLTCFEW